jgi:hypothetical protein
LSLHGGVSLLRASNSEWARHKGRFSLRFNGTPDEKKRMSIWTSRIGLINKHNSDPQNTFVLGLNKFSHLTHEEIALKHLGYVKDNAKALKILNGKRKFIQNPSENDNKSQQVDFRRRGGRRESIPRKGDPINRTTTTTTTKATTEAKQTTTSRKPITTTKKTTTTTRKTTTTTRKTTTTTRKTTTTTTTATTTIAAQTTIDWRNTSMVGPIKDQQSCG